MSMSNNFFSKGKRTLMPIYARSYLNPAAESHKTQVQQTAAPKHNTYVRGSDSERPTSQDVLVAHTTLLPGNQAVHLHNTHLPFKVLEHHLYIFHLTRTLFCLLQILGKPFSPVQSVTSSAEIFVGKICCTLFGKHWQFGTCFRVPNFSF